MTTEQHMRRMRAHGWASKLTDDEIDKLLTQAQFNAISEPHREIWWAKVAEAMKELQERRQQDGAKEST